MTEFTPEWIAKARNACIFFGEPATTEFRKALDEIERLQKENKELKEFVDATRPTGICEICTSNVISRYERLQARVQELETQLKSKDIIINNQQGRLNYYATKDLLGGKNEHG